jgi:signal transduction histidine kinase
MAESPVSPQAPVREDELPRPPGAVRRFWSGHPLLVDAVLAGVYLLFATLWATVTPLSSGVWSPFGPILVPLVGGIVATASLFVRRRRPWVTFAVFGAVAALCLVVDAPAEPFGIAIALYAVFVYRSNRSGWIGFGIATLAGCILFPAIDAALRGRQESPLSSAPTGLLLLVVLLVSALLGVTVGDRRRYIGAILDRANQLARERDQQARLATLAERARITREIHDVVAHSVSVMVSLADGAAALAEKDPTRARSAVQEIGAVGRQSLLEMRQLLGALGDEGTDGEERSPLQPNPGVGDLAALVETFRTAGLPVVTRTHGEPPASPALQNAVFRIVQEALTNVLRYAAEPRTVSVTLDFREGAVVVAVVDDGRAGPPAESVGSGRGLVGIRERVRLYGGTADAGPIEGGGWRVHVEMPEQEAQR